MTIIQPTIGRKLHVHYSRKDGACPGDLILMGAHRLRVCFPDQPFDATVIGVRLLGHVRVKVTDHDGDQHTMDLQLRQAGEEQPNHPLWLEWMPYQVGQAAQTKAAEAGRDMAAASNQDAADKTRSASSTFTAAMNLGAAQHRLRQAREKHSALKADWRRMEAASVEKSNEVDHAEAEVNAAMRDLHAIAEDGAA